MRLHTPWVTQAALLDLVLYWQLDYSKLHLAANTEGKRARGAPDDGWVVLFEPQLGLLGPKK